MHPSAQDQTEEYLDHLAHGRRLSTLTIQSYRRDLAMLRDFCDRHQIDGWAKWIPRMPDVSWRTPIVAELPAEVCDVIYQQRVLSIDS